jgi:hypothetical protein
MGVDKEKVEGGRSVGNGGGEAVGATAATTVIDESN